MTWQSRLKPEELAELKNAERLRDDKRAEYNMIVAKLKQRVKRMIRKEMERSE